MADTYIHQACLFLSYKTFWTTVFYSSEDTLTIANPCMYSARVFFNLNNRLKAARTGIEGILVYTM